MSDTMTILPLYIQERLDTYYPITQPTRNDPAQARELASDIAEWVQGEPQYASDILAAVRAQRSDVHTMLCAFLSNNVFPMLQMQIDLLLSVLALQKGMDMVDLCPQGHKAPRDSLIGTRRAFIVAVQTAQRFVPNLYCNTTLTETVGASGSPTSRLLGHVTYDTYPLFPCHKAIGLAPYGRDA